MLPIKSTFLFVALMLLYPMYIFGEVSVSPSHESSIILIGQYEDDLYSLDSNGLLLQNNLDTHSTKFSIPLRKSVQYAFFQYPYIVLVDTSNNLYVFDILNSFIRFEDSLDEAQDSSSISFSKDLSIFSYSKNNSIHILHTDSWNLLRVIEISSPAIYSVISQNNQNIMTYQKNGNIEYHDIYNGKLLRNVKTTTILDGFILNTSLRYGVGYNANTLISIDVITGEIVDTILFLNRINNIFKDYTDESNVYFNSVTKLNVHSENIKNFSIDKDGNIRENDLFNITNQNQSSYIFGNGSHTYVGLKDGEIWSFDRNTQNLDKSILVEDDTLAIYDAIYTNSSIILLNYNGILSVPIDPNSSKPITSNPKLITQSMQYPSFIVKDTWTDRSHTKQEVHILSSDTPYNYTIPNTLNQHYILESNTKPIPKNKLRTNSPTLLFQLNENLEPVLPQSFAPHIDRVESSESLTLMYSSNESTFYINDENKQLQMPLLAPRFIFKTTSNSLFQDATTNQKIIWTNTALDSKESKYLPDAKNNILYTYEFEAGLLKKKFIPLELSFLKEDIFDFGFISIDPYILFVTSVDEKRDTSSFYIINTPSRSNTLQEDKNVDYPTLVQKLYEISTAHILKTVSLNRDKDLWMVFTDDNIFILKINTEDAQIDFVYTIRYPNHFGVLQNARVSRIQSPKKNTNNSFTNVYVISMVDKNNTVLILGLNEIFQLSNISSFIIKNDNTVKFYNLPRSSNNLGSSVN